MRSGGWDLKIHLPGQLEDQIREAVRSGRFPSVDEAMAEAARLLMRELDRMSGPPAGDAGTAPDPILGAMRDYADELDEIVADAYRVRAAGWDEPNPESRSDRPT